ncbi:MAG TPA: zinc-binding dehydrogenase [Acetobacteraceae bacterium]|nr:zinc-binding dehydrogenase [Acetobacteraceae bacterium]
MKAAVLKAFGSPLAIEEVDDPRPGPDEVLVKVMACGIDGTDLKLLDGFGYTPRLPFIMGHEPAGIVESVGERVHAFARGDRVIPYIFLVSPENPSYQTGREQLCPDMLGVLGVKGWNGGYAEKLLLPAHQLVPIPAGIAWHDAAVHCDAGLTAYHAVRRARLGLSDTVLVIGVGGVGSFAVQFANLAGACVIAVEQTEAKRDWARRLGAAETLSSVDVGPAVRALTNRRGVDCVLDLVGSKDTIAAGLDSVSTGGRIVMVGYTTDSLVLSGKNLAQNELEVIGSRAGSRRELHASLDLAAAGRIHSIVTDRFPFDRVNEALARLATGQVLGRLVLDMGRHTPSGGEREDR